MELFRKNKIKADRYHRDFRRIFGVSLVKYHDFLTGFDIVKFDEEVLQPPPGKSARDIVIEKYGQDGLAVIEGLL